MKLAAAALLFTALAGGLCGCGWRMQKETKQDETATLRADFAREKEELFRQLRHENRSLMLPFYADAAKFFQDGCDAYFIIGFEYYSLAKELKDKGEAEKAQDCFVKAKLYQDLSRTMRSSAESAHKQAQALQPQPGAPATGSGAATTPPPASQPAAAVSSTIE